MTADANNRYYSTAPVGIALLVFVWIFGLTVGYLLCEPFFFPLMRSAVIQPVSIVGLVIDIFLPLFITYYSILFRKPIFILIVCFIKSVAFAFSGTLLVHIFGTASWLLRLLFLFSDSFFLFFLMALWLKSLSGINRLPRRSIQIYCVMGILICATDYFVVSPLLVRLF